MTHLNPFLIAEIGGEALEGDAQLGRAFLGTPMESDGIVRDFLGRAENADGSLGVGV